MNGRPEGGNAEQPIRLEGFAERDLYQRREKIYTRFVGGFFQRLRFLTGWPLLAGYFLLPWLSWDGRQAVLFDLPARQFHIFTLTFWPQDFWLLGWLLIIAAFALFTFTTLVGRIWCGYTCPQTVWTAIFMWIEQVTEGQRHQRIRLDQAPWSFEKLRKRGMKHAMWLTVALLTGLTFVGYFAPIRELTVDLVTLQAHPWANFWVAFFTVATYVNAGWMREQVCIYMCPYARFQSVMFDPDTLIVSYDAGRGEPRGARKRNERPADLGDCIDCTLCVQVCPTGIDIRDGLQYECIGCAQCIDACNQVMDKMGYPQGLIRYTTEHELQGGRTRWLRPRAVGYAIALLVMIGALSYALATRSALEVSVLRDRGELFQREAPDLIVNHYRLRILNKTQRDMSAEVRVEAAVPVIDSIEAAIALLPGEQLDLPLELRVAQPDLVGPSVPVTITVCDTFSGRCNRERTTFIGGTP
jgi:cytochrome c oxidase accessory protein FixG